MSHRIFLYLLTAVLLISAVRGQPEISGRPVVIALPERFSVLDTLSNTITDAAADRLRTLIYNSLVKRNEKFEYVGELGDYKIGDDNLTVTYTLRDNIKFHNGKVMMSADVKYTFDALFQANGAKAGSLYDSVPDETDPEKKKTKRVAHLSSIETPDPKTVVFKVTRPELVNQLLSNLVTIPIIPEGTIDRQKTAPVGSGPFKFGSFDQVKSIVRLEVFNDYWEGAPKIAKLDVRTVADPEALQNELLSGGVDLVLNPTILSPEQLKELERSSKLSVRYFPGSNIQYIGFNTKAAPFNKVKVRQAVGYAIDREKIIGELLNDQTRPAASILPENSWAFAAGTKYVYDPAKARRLLKAAGYRGGIVRFKYPSGNRAVSQIAQLVQEMLKEVGFRVELETLEPLTLIEALKMGQFQMNIGIWIGGNQDPVFLRDLFASSDSPEKKLNGRNRARFSNPQFDRIIDEAVKTTDRAKAARLYAGAQEIVSRELPLLPLWYPANVVVAGKRIKNPEAVSGGDWSLVKRLEIAE
ncbi:MAG: ABC transporter substrate-binding protein [Acidobacteria bacterium]|nr:ABC transporter substrate-binding protein [Acidobacteriota bacterium]